MPAHARGNPPPGHPLLVVGGVGHRDWEILPATATSLLLRKATSPAAIARLEQEGAQLSARTFIAGSRVGAIMSAAGPF